MQPNPNVSFDRLVFIGRFQIFHKGHLHVVKEALERANSLLVLIGSVNQPRSLRDPFTFEERKLMILSCLSQEEQDRVLVLPLPDQTYNNALWIQRVQGIIPGESEKKVGLIGHSKDRSSYYLKLFPHLDSVDVSNYQGIASTELRKLLMQGKIAPQIPMPVRQHLETFLETPAFQNLQEESRFIENYKKGWEPAPYTPIFVTVDALVVQSGHILLVERKAFPGKGLWALPGGFLRQEETLLEGAIRELREETKLKVPAPVLVGSNKASRVFDDPFRSVRGRTITHVFLFTLRDDTELPKVRGGHDAKKAFWVKLSDIKRETLFEDHYYIIQNMLSLI